MGVCVVPFTGMGKSAEGEGLWKGKQEFALDILSLSLDILVEMSPDGYKSRAERQVRTTAINLGVTSTSVVLDEIRSPSRRVR